MDIQLNNEEILFYIGILTILCFIWFSSKINITYIFPFIIFCFIFYYFENKKMDENNDLLLNINLIKQDLLTENHIYIIDNDVLFFIDSLRDIREYDSETFNQFLDLLNIYYRDRTIEKLLLVMNKYENLYHSIPLELTDLYVEKQNELNILLKNILLENEMKKVEMQSFIPNTYIDNNYNL